MTTTVGIREFKNGVSGFVRAAEAGETVVVTDRGRPVARLAGIASAGADALDRLVAEGVARPPTAARALPEPARSAGTVSDLVADQRR